MEEVPCNICKSMSDEKIYYLNRDNTKITISRCKKCGLIYQNPRPTENEIIESYDEQKKHYKSEPTPENEKFFLALANGRMKNIEKFCKKGRLLDIGSAFGPLIGTAKRRGWDSEGIELTKYMARFCERKYGVKVHTKVLEKIKFNRGTFDVVTMYDLIEHLTDPMRTLKECNRVMRKGGILVIQTPAIDSVYAKLKGGGWPYFGLQHLYYFSKDTMKRSLNAAGFSIVKIFDGDDIGMKSHIKSSKNLRYLLFNTVRRINIGTTLGSRVYYSTKVSEA